MIVFFNPETRRVHHVITFAPSNHAAYLAENPPVGEAWIETDEIYPIEEIEVVENAGELSVRRRQRMTLTYPNTAQVGEEFAILGVPADMTISVNGQILGQMDQSGLIEFLPEIGGVYKFRLEGPGYMTEEFDVEAVS